MNHLVILGLFAMSVWAGVAQNVSLANNSLDIEDGASILAEGESELHNIEIHNMNTTGSRNASEGNQTGRHHTKSKENASWSKSEQVSSLLWLWAGFTFVFVLVLNMLRRPAENCWVYFPYMLIMMFGFGILPAIAEEIEYSDYDTWDNSSIDLDINPWIDAIKIIGLARINAIRVEKVEWNYHRNHTQVEENGQNWSMPTVHSGGSRLASNFYSNALGVMMIGIEVLKSQIVQVGPKSFIPEVPEYQMQDYIILLCLACGLLALVIILCCVAKCVLR